MTSRLPHYHKQINLLFPGTDILYKSANKNRKSYFAPQKCPIRLSSKDFDLFYLYFNSLKIEYSDGTVQLLVNFQISNSQSRKFDKIYHYVKLLRKGLIISAYLS